jgi:hypothetical protein
LIDVEPPYLVLKPLLTGVGPLCNIARCCGWRHQQNAS